MEKRTIDGIKILYVISSAFLLIVMLYFIIGESASEKETSYIVEESTSYNDGWVMVNSDGTKIPIAVPGAYDIKYGEVLRIEKKLPDDLKNTWICIRSTQQDITISIDDEVRTYYSTKGSRKFGKNSVSVYVFAELFPEDAGKTLSMEIVSFSTYSGYVNEIYEGGREQIWTGLIKKYLPVTILALFMLVLSLMVVIYCIIIRCVYKKNMDIAHLGLALLVSSVWIISESKLRQLFMPNSTIASDVGFFMIMLIPFPFLLYINKIQKGRYEKSYIVIGCCSVINCIVSTVLQLTDTKDFSETMGISHVLIIFFIVTMFATVIIDTKKKHIKEYKEVAVGLAGLMLAGIGEIYQVYDEAAVNNGISLCIGLVFLFFMAVIQTGRDLLELEREKQIAVAASESRTMFLANMSHEIRTPINTIVGMNEMILRENKDNETKEYARNIDNASKMLIGLIDDILDFSKLEVGKLDITDNPYNVATMFNDVLLGASVRLQDKNVRIKYNIDKNIPAILNGDELRVKQIYNNILSNAVKYTEEGSICIEAKSEWENEMFYLVFSVEDTGVGIREEDLPTLFDSFRRMDMKRNKYIQGTGLGLNITKQLIDNMNGTIDVKSEYGKGSCFIVKIPQDVVDKTPMGDLTNVYEIQNVNDEDTQLLEFSSHYHVLVVDDNEMNLTVMKALLGKTGLTLDFVNSGTECIKLCKVNKYDLIFMDHMMPEPDGIETLHIIKSDSEGLNKDTTVIVLTANAIKGASNQYEKEGFADYITKPVEYKKLEGVLTKYLMHEKDENYNLKQYHLDKKAGITYCGDIEELYYEILGDYIIKLKDYKKEIEKYYTDNNWTEYARIAHTIKSTSLTIGLLDFPDIAKKHELAAKESDIDYINQDYNNFMQCIDNAIMSVQKEKNND